MYRLMEALRAWTENPYVNLVVALVLVITGVQEAWDTLGVDLASLNFGVHHGAIVYGLLHALKTLPDIVEGAERLKLRVGE